MIIGIRKHNPEPIDGGIVHAIGGDHPVAHELDVVLAELVGGIEQVADLQAGHSRRQSHVDVGLGARGAPARRADGEVIPSCSARGEGGGWEGRGAGGEGASVEEAAGRGC